jgi:hypothetical protein
LARLLAGGITLVKAYSALQTLNVWACAGTIKTAARENAIAIGKRIAVCFFIVRVPRFEQRTLR